MHQLQLMSVKNTLAEDISVLQRDAGAHLDSRLIPGNLSDFNCRFPNVVRLSLNLPGENEVRFDERDDAVDVVGVAGEKRTKLEMYFHQNVIDDNSRQYTYSDFPKYYSWNCKENCWKKRRNEIGTLGRIYWVDMKNQEKFALRLLLHHITGPTSYQTVRTHKGIEYATFQAAALAMGLLADDQEFKRLLEEAGLLQLPCLMRNLFVSILINCEVANAQYLWETYGALMAEDILHEMRRRTRNIELQMTPGIINSALLLIERKVQCAGRQSVSQFGINPPIMPVDVADDDERNPLIREALSFMADPEIQGRIDTALLLLSPSQQNAYNTVMNGYTIADDPKLFYIDGPGGTGKTFLFTLLIDRIRNEGDIVVVVGSSGICSILMIGGKTAHSVFKIPTKAADGQFCSFDANSFTADYLRRSKAIFFDEAPMMHRFHIEAIDRSVRDTCRHEDGTESNKAFAGKLCIFGGDFRQTAPGMYFKSF